MTTVSLREQLVQQLNELPDELIAEIADFTAFVLARRGMLTIDAADPTETDWQEFVLSQFLRDTDDDVEYTLDDAQVVYHR